MTKPRPTSGMASSAIKHWIFLRGLSREHAHWGDFIQRCEIELDWHCYTLDLPGFGSEHQRPSPITIAEIRQDVQSRLPKELNSNKQPIGIIALSLGGMVALDWLANDPENIYEAILIGTSSADCGLSKRLKFNAIPSTLHALFAMTARKQEQAILTMVSNNRHRHAEVLDLWCRIRELRPTKKQNVIRQLIAASRFNSPSAQSLNNIKGHFISSRADRMVSFQCSEYLAKKYHWPLTLHNTAGHDLPIDDADWLIHTLKSISGQTC